MPMLILSPCVRSRCTVDIEIVKLGEKILILKVSILLDCSKIVFLHIFIVCIRSRCTVDIEIVKLGENS